MSTSYIILHKHMIMIGISTNAFQLRIVVMLMATWYLEYG
jgi:hypothetical protein